MEDLDLNLSAASNSLNAFAGKNSRNRMSAIFLDAVAAYMSGEHDVALRLTEPLERETAASGIETLEALRLKFFVQLARGETDDSERIAAKIGKLADERGDPRWRGTALALSSAANLEKGHAPYGIDLARRAKSLLVDTGSATELARACYQLGYGLLLRGDLVAARVELESAVAIARTVEDHFTEALANRRLGFCLVQLCDYAGARSAYSRALDVFESQEIEWRAAQIRYGLAVLEIVQGDLAAARQHVEISRTSYERGAELPLNRWRLMAGWLATWEGNSASALELIRKARSAFYAANAQRDLALCDEFEGDAHGLLGKDEESIKFYESAIGNGRRVSPTADVVVESTRKLGETLSRLERFPEAVLMARRANQLARIYTEPLEKAAILRLRGVIKILRGRSRVGIALLEASWKIFFRIGAAIEAQVAARIIGRVLQDQGLSERSEQWLKWGGEGDLPTLRLIWRQRDTTQAKAPKRSAKRDLISRAATQGIITQDSRILKTFEIVSRAAPLQMPVLVFGETGTGKELFAGLAHDLSGRKGGLLAINCAALPPDILDAELFGHTKGAYTGAYRDRPGLIEAASDGTLFLDEIGEMTLGVQGRLLRAIEAHEVRRLGENHPRKVNTRFVGATHRDLESMVREGSFRADLFFRLRGAVVKLPPLRERPDDILLLAGHFLRGTEVWLGRKVELSEAARATLLAHPWPGNVRELKNVIECSAAMCESGSVIAPDDLGLEKIRVAGSLEEHLEDEERRHLIATLESVDWNRSKAARVLRLKRTTLLGKLKRLGIEVPRKK